MDHSSAHHQQEIARHQTLESMLVCPKAAQDKKPKPPDQQPQKCPRCDSSNTKFCYYNNYSLTQPRYFCKSCRRYWTKGGTLRNVPVGGGCRKNRRSSSSCSSISSSKIRTLDHLQSPLIQTNPLLGYDSTDLSLAFARLQNGQLGFDHYNHNQNQEHDHFSVMGNNHNSSTTPGFLDAFRTGFLENSNNVNGFQNAYYGNNIGNNAENVNVEDQMGNLPYEDLMSGNTSGATTTAVTVGNNAKQEGSAVFREAAVVAPENGRVLWGFPWQLGGGDGIMGDVDVAGRQSSWITGSTNWHGLVNTPLM